MSKYIFSEKNEYENLINNSNSSEIYNNIENYIKNDTENNISDYIDDFSDTLTADKMADYFIALSNKTQNLITNLKLQKLLYYTNCWFLTVFNKKLFKSEFEAWIHGPVLPSIYGKYKHFKWNPISKELNNDIIISNIEKKLTSDEKDILSQVVDEYFGLTAYQLEQLTHIEEPWIKARKGLNPDDLSRNIIEDEWIKEYYSKFIVD